MNSVSQPTYCGSSSPSSMYECVTIVLPNQIFSQTVNQKSILGCLKHGFHQAKIFGEKCFFNILWLDIGRFYE